MATRPPTVRLPRRETRQPGKSSGGWHAALARSGVAMALLAGAEGLAAGCGPRGAPPCAGRDYALRGQVAAATARGSGPRLITLRHEPIDDFADRQGQVVGMDSMVMAFPVARGVPPAQIAEIAAVAPGDTVAVRLCVDWQAAPEVAVTALRKLPAGTRLDFRPARPAARSGSAP